MERTPEYNKTIEVDGDKYLVNHPQVEEAFEVGVDLLKMIGGSAASMAMGAKDEATAAAMLSVAVNGLLAKVDGKDSMKLIKRLLKNVEVQGNEDAGVKRMMLDEAGLRKHFHGRLGSMLKVVGEVVAFTHKDFFLAIGEGVADLMKMVEEKQ